MKKPLVSVIMAEYNTDVELLKDSINSIINQTYSNLELILIDDCGKNSSLLDKIVADVNDKRVKLYKNKVNKGLTYSLNRAIDLSRGEYIARMDTDDFSYPNRIEEEMAFFIEHPEYDLIGSRCDFYDGKEIWGESKDHGEVTREKLLNGCPLVHPSVIYRKSSIKEIGCYKDYKRSEDYATWITLFVNKHRMFVIDKKLIRYHLSIEDYQKRTLKTRKQFFNVLKNEYLQLNPKKIDIIKIKLKTVIAGTIPWKLMFAYHKKVFKIK